MAKSISSINLLITWHLMYAKEITIALRLWKTTIRYQVKEDVKILNIIHL